MSKKLFLVLHNIRSAYNVGAIFRSADGAGVSKIYLTGYSPAPSEGKKVFGATTKADKMIGKTALGAEASVAWEKFTEIEELLEKFKKEKIAVVALEKNKDSLSIEEFDASFPMALILGNEVDGVPEEVLEKCDAVIAIPMRGLKESLNVSVAAGIAMYQILG